MTSAELIAELLASGETYASIGRAIGRDKSLIRQVARGTKPGRNLTDALAAVTRREHVPEPPRRRTRTGEPARVRQPRSTPASTPQRRTGGEPVSRSRIAGRTNLPPGGRMAAGAFGDWNGVAWRLAGWSDQDYGHGITYRDVEGGAADPPERGKARYITVYIEGTGYRQARFYPTDDYDWEDAVMELLEAYGEAYAA